MATSRRTPPEPPARLRSDPEPKSRYDVVIVGAGGHGLATAYHLARDHGIRDVAVLERGRLAGGNTARNAMIVRSDHLLDESTALYDHALGLREQLPDELVHDFLLSQCGVLNLAHTEQEVRESRRRAFANRLDGVETEWLAPEEVAEFCPVPDTSRGGRR